MKGRDLAVLALLTASIDEALPWSRKALKLAPADGGTEVLARELHIHGYVRCESGDVGGIDDLNESLRLNEAAGDPSGTFRGYSNLAGRCLLAVGRLSEASTALHAARDVFDQLGARPLMEKADRYLGEVTALSS